MAAGDAIRIGDSEGLGVDVQGDQVSMEGVPDDVGLLRSCIRTMGSGSEATYKILNSDVCGSM